MISIELLQIFGVITAIFCGFAIYKCRRLKYIPLHWLFFAAWGVASLGIMAFYFEIGHGHFNRLQLIDISRLLWFYVMLIISLQAISVLIYRE